MMIINYSKALPHLFLILFLCFGIILLPCCQANVVKMDVTAIAENIRELNQNGSHDTSSKKLRYTLKNKEWSQILELSFVGEKEVIFALSLDGECNRTLSGKAVNRALGSDSEIDEDEAGIAYPADQFTYEESTGCFIAIRIDRKKNENIRIQEANCQSGCPLQKGIMKPVK